MTKTYIGNDKLCAVSLTEICCTKKHKNHTKYPGLFLHTVPEVQYFEHHVQDNYHVSYNIKLYLFSILL